MNICKLTIEPSEAAGKAHRALCNKGCHCIGREVASGPCFNEDRHLRCKHSDNSIAFVLFTDFLVIGECQVIENGRNVKIN